MTEQEIRSEFKKMQNRANGMKRATLLHVVMDENQTLIGAEIQSDKEVLLKWPETFQSQLPPPALKNLTERELKELAETKRAGYTKNVNYTLQDYVVPQAELRAAV